MKLSFLAVSTKALGMVANTQSSDDYDEAEDEEQRQLSWTISKRKSTPKPMPVEGSSTGSP